MLHIMLHLENATERSRFLFFGAIIAMHDDSEAAIHRRLTPSSCWTCQIQGPANTSDPGSDLAFDASRPRIACHAAHVAQRAAWHVASAHGTRVLVKQHQYGEKRQRNAKEACNSQPFELGFRKSSLHLFKKRAASSLPCSANGAFRSVNGLRLSPYRPSLTTERRNHRKSSPYATSLTKEDEGPREPQNFGQNSP